MTLDFKMKPTRQDTVAKIRLIYGEDHYSKIAKMGGRPPKIDPSEYQEVEAFHLAYGTKKTAAKYGVSRRTINRIVKL